MLVFIMSTQMLHCAGRLAMRIAYDAPDSSTNFAVVHVNDLASVESAAYLLKYDSVHGTWRHDVEVDGDGRIRITHADTGTVTMIGYSQEGTAQGLVKLLADLGTDYTMVLEGTGVHLTRAKLNPYLECTGGDASGKAKKIVVTAPVKDPEQPAANIVYGVNHDTYDAAKDDIVTAASCTTNCLAPVVKVIHENLKIKHGCITTVHDVTNTQSILDCPNHKKSDLRRARSALVNLAPTSTGSATAIALIFPELKGKLNGLAVRVPLTNASITDCVFEVERETTVDEVNEMLKQASEGNLKGILGYEPLPLVSTDYINDTRSGIVDALSTQVIDGTMVKIYVWYDNEMGYSCRFVDVASMVAKNL
jgi:glyceraldehyde 3-phosphate dehydrogenase